LAAVVNNHNNHQERRSWEVGCPDPLKICRRVRVCFVPWKCHILSFKTVVYCKFHSINDEQLDTGMNTWTLSLHWSCLCWRCYHSYVWSAASRQCPPINPFAAALDLRYDCPRQNSKTWVQVTRRRQSSEIMAHAVLPMIDRLQLGWLTRGVDPGGWEILTPKICRKGQSMFWPMKMSHSFIQNCCCITASFTASRMKSWTLSLHWSCLCWRC